MYFTDMNETTHTPHEIQAVNFAHDIDAMDGFLDGSFRPNELINVFSIDVTLSSVFLSNEQRANHNYPVMNIISYFKNHGANETLTVYDLKQILDEVFNPLMIKPLQPSESIQEKDEFNDTDHATRLDLALLFCQHCKQFLMQLTDQPLSEQCRKQFIDHWENAPLSPYPLICKLYHTPPVIPHSMENKDYLEILLYFRSVDHKKASTSYEKIILINRSFSPINTESFSHGYQYTSLSALYQMLTKSNAAKHNQAPSIYLHMNNAITLNDPREGQLFDDYVTNGSANLKAFHPNNHTYILSLSSDEKENLSMWVQYGDNGKGCRIEFDTSPLPFHQVLYSNKLPPISKHYRDIFQKFSKSNWEKDSPEFNYLNDMYNKYRFYFKDEAYQTEKEIRYIINTFPQFAKEHPIRAGEFFPRLFCETQNPLPIKSIMLGPKCPNPDYVELYLKRVNVPEITRSEIQYR